MKYLVFSLLILAGCTPQPPPVVPPNAMNPGIARFETSDAICYTLYDHAISCIPKAETK